MSSIDNLINFLETKVYSFSHLGIKEVENGAILIGHIPHVAKFAYLHHLFAALGVDEILKWQDYFSTSLDLELIEFYQKYNGISLYNHGLNIYGNRKSGSRQDENFVWQPFDIFTPNNVERKKDALPSHFFIGSFSRNASYNSTIYLDTSTSKYYECAKKNSVEPFMSWNSLSEMLKYYIELLDSCFDKQGKQIKIWRIPPILS